MDGAGQGGGMDFTWPGGADAAVCLTFDVDAEAGWIGTGRPYDHRLTSLSEARYGVVRGLPRILDLLARHNIRGTFFVPGLTAQRHPAAVASIIAGGHEVGHHGHLHLRSDKVTADEQRQEIERGI